MGILGKIVSGLEVGAGIALEFVPGMQLAGAALIVGGLSSSGLIGGSVGQFLKSGWGQAMIAAVGIGSTAYAAFGQSVAGTAGAASAQTSAEAGATATGGETTQVANSMSAQLADASGGDAQLATGNAIANSAGVNPTSLATPGSTAIGGSNMAGVTQVPSISATGAPVSEEQAVLNTQAAATGQPMGEQVAGTAESTNQGAVAGYRASANAVPAESTGPPVGAYSGAQGDAADQTLAAAQGGGGGTPGMGGYTTNPINPQLDMPGQGGFLNWMKGGGGGGGISPMSAAIMGGGQMLGGLGGGMMQKQAMQEQINAQMAPFNSWNSSKTGAIPTAPINVPGGYLARAQALRNMLNNTPGGGIAQTPTATPPPTMGPTMGGPVPVLGMNSTPRGGMPGG